VSFAAIIIAALLLASFRLTGRYEYGLRSRRLLGLVLAGSFAAAFLIAYYFYDIRGGLYLSLATVGLTIPIFVFGALALVETLRFGKQQVFGRRLEVLRLKEQEALERIDALDRRLRERLKDGEQADRTRREREKELESHRKRVEAWKREGGVARIRSIKLEEWERELGALDAEGLEARRREAEEELARGSDPERRSQLQVIISLCVLTAEGSRLKEAVSTSDKVRQDVSGASEERREAEREVERLRAEMQAVRRRIEDFLSKEIVLD